MTRRNPPPDLDAAAAAARDSWVPPDDAPWLAYPVQRKRLKERRERRLRLAGHALRAAAVTALAVAATLALTGEARPHSWYDADCCDTRDCAPVPAARIVPEGDGWRVTILPGQHPLATAPVEVVLRGSAVRLSQDHQPHACVVATGGDWGDFTGGLTIRCVYLPWGM